jgi:hypothetical protein
MRKIFIIILLFISCKSVDLQVKQNDVFMLIDKSFTIIKLKDNNYIIEFSINSKDSRFSFDTYSFEPYKLHEFLSLKKNIFFVRKNEKNEKVYFRSIYKGTVKNMQSLKNNH